MCRPLRWLPLGVVLGWSTAALAANEAIPAPLRCLQRYYGLAFELVDGRPFVVLPDGTRLPYDDGRVKSFEERLNAPDVEDMFSIPYRRGPVRPVTTPDEDPGRIRLEPMFAAIYGKTPAEVDLVPVRLVGQLLRVHRKAAPAFRRVDERLKRLLAERPALRPFLTGLGGTFSWRKIAGTGRQSAHSYGVSLDINVRRAHYWRWQRPPKPLRWQNQVPQEIVDVFEAEGFIWGGRWYHYDTMHFEYRPELLDPTCYP
ncbi:MAG: M15 family metallopeptidase [Myxococcales bacterium]|nr:M15 family metallopeptidase [Myxococcota bacterium]MDW8283323.1 M15 family metallopeptidase [Myxococcales bacterium]